LASEIPERCELKAIAFFSNHSTFYHGRFDELEFLISHTSEDRLNPAFVSNYVYGPPGTVYYRPTIDVKYEVGLWNEFVFDTTFTYNGEENLLLEIRYNGCNNRSIYNLGWLYGNSDRVVDGFLGQDTGFPRDSMPSFRLIFSPLTTISARMSCLPASGTLPFTSAVTVELVNNVPDQARTAAGHIDLTLGNGMAYGNWRSGWVELTPEGWHRRTWNQTIPAHPAYRGNSEFRLVMEDVTPAPYNQPPYIASGDVSSRFCTVTGVVP
jgi:hypothetical protein